MGKVVTKVRRDAAGRPRGVTIPDHLDILAEMACGAQAHFVISSVAGEHAGPPVSNEACMRAMVTISLCAAWLV